MIQAADVSAGLKNYLRPFTPFSSTIDSRDQIWGVLAKKYKVLKTTYPVNYSIFYSRFAYLIEKNKIKKTNIVRLSRINRKAVAQAKYHINDTLLLRQLFYLFLLV